MQPYMFLVLFFIRVEEIRPWWHWTRPFSKSWQSIVAGIEVRQPLMTDEVLQQSPFQIWYWSPNPTRLHVYFISCAIFNIILCGILFCLDELAFHGFRLRVLSFPHISDLCRIFISELWLRLSKNVPVTQYGHSKFALFTFPQAEHLFKLVTSFRAFPAMNRWRFFRWEVFFLGTARRTASQISASIGGIFNVIHIGTIPETLSCQLRPIYWARLNVALERKVGLTTADHGEARLNNGGRACRNAMKK